MGPVTAVTVRRAVAGDVEGLTRLAREAYGPYVERIGVRPAPLDDDYAAAVADREVWVAERAGCTVGLLVLQRYDDHLLLENVAVAPAAQGAGVGSTLLALAERRAREQHLPEVRLYTNAAMTGNIAYYGRRGYRETARTEEHGFHRVFFTKPV